MFITTIKLFLITTKHLFDCQKLRQTFLLQNNYRSSIWSIRFTLISKYLIRLSSQLYQYIG